MASDTFVFLDDVQYEKDGWHNRNKIRTSNGSMWLTIPIKSKLNVGINEAQIDNTHAWLEKHKKSIQINYSKSSHFDNLWKDLEQIYEKKYDLLIDINMKIISLVLKKFEISTKVIFSSELQIKTKGSKRILDICKSLNADVYLSGAFGVNYLDSQSFIDNHIEVKYQNFQHPFYNQVYAPFVPNMAAIDLIFNEGINSGFILRDAKNF